MQPTNELMKVIILHKSLRPADATLHRVIAANGKDQMQHPSGSISMGATESEWSENIDCDESYALVPDFTLVKNDCNLSIMKGSKRSGWE